MEGKKIVQSRGRDWLWDILFPRRCPVCDEIIEFRRGYICRSCLEKIKFVGERHCMKCGKELKEETQYCPDCQNRVHLYRQGLAVFEYGSVAEAIYRFKYGGRREYADFFGRCMAKRLMEMQNLWKVQALIPVPVHPSRKRARGYNQSQLLAEVISGQTGIPVYSHFIARRKKTVPQKGLDERERQNNLKRAFKIIKNDVKLSTIVIIDDIYTTGSTINSMAAALHEAGVTDIYYAALAIGRGL